MAGYFLPLKERTLLEGNIGRPKILKSYRFNTHLFDGVACVTGDGARISGGGTYISWDSLAEPS